MEDREGREGPGRHGGAPVVVLVGTLDTKGSEYAYLKQRLEGHGVEVVVVDAGVREPRGLEPEIGRDAVARAAGADIGALEAAGDRGAAVTTMAAGAAATVLGLFEQGRCHGVLGAGGSGNTVIATAAMRSLPVGVPKLMVSTLAAGDTRDHVGGTDLTLMAAVVDVAGINSISARVLANAAAAMAGMASAEAPELAGGRPLVAATMFGVTTPGVEAAREELERRGYEVLVFHATGTGGRAMEGLVSSGFFAGVLDLTTTELADELVGGILSAGPARLEAAGRAGVPQVVSLGALDMVNFGPRETVPERFEKRRLYVHNPAVTLMRTTANECAELGRVLARKLSAAEGPAALWVPLQGVSAIDVEGAVFHDPAADAALFAAIREHLSDDVELHEEEADVNDPEFARAMARRLDEMVRAGVPA